MTLLELEKLLQELKRQEITFLGIFVLPDPNREIPIEQRVPADLVTIMNGHQGLLLDATVESFYNNPQMLDFFRMAVQTYYADKAHMDLEIQKAKSKDQIN